MGDSELTAHHTVLVKMCLHLKPTRFSGWVVHGVIPEDVKSFSATLHFEDFPSSDVGCDVIKDLCRPLILEDGHVECKTVTFHFLDARVSGYNAHVSGYLKSVEITEKPDFWLVHFEFIPV